MSSTLQPLDSIDTITAAFQAAPGTELLYDQEDDQGDQAWRLHTLQHVKEGDAHILLVPQPSLTDPNDPLLWPSVKKWLAFANGLGYSFLGAVTGPIMAAGKLAVLLAVICLLEIGMVQLSEFFQVPFQKLTYANGATLVCQGVATTLWMYDIPLLHELR